MITDEQLRSAEQVILRSHQLADHLRSYSEISDDPAMIRSMSLVGEAIDMTVDILGSLLAEVKDLTGR